MNTDLPLSISIPLTDLSRLLLEQGKSRADTLICAKGRFYRATMTLERVPEEDLKDVIDEYL